MEGVAVFDSLRLDRELDENATLATDRTLRMSVLDFTRNTVTLVFTGVTVLRREDTRLFEHMTRLSAPSVRERSSK
jgi:hypothetical protein